MTENILEVQQNTANSSLNTMELISQKAKVSKNAHSSGQAVLNNNISDSISPAAKLRNISKTYFEQNRALENEPFIMQVRYVDEDDIEKVIYFCRGGNGSFSIPKVMLTNIRKNIGHLASLNPGDEYEVRLNGRDRYFKIVEKLEVAPIRANGAWEALNSKFYLGETGKFTIPSLRGLIELSDVNFSDEDLFGEDAVFEGFKRDVLTSRYLRDQANLDKFQSDIFRLPLNSQCFLHGPPGTGKTTTLIRRLGQKTDVLALEDNGEAHLISNLQESFETFEDNWIMFFPTELLKLYVKEAFAKEGIAAPESRIKTWTSFRKQIGITLKVLRSNADKNGMIISDKNSEHLSEDATDRRQTEWFDDFYTFQETRYFEQLTNSCQWLEKQNEPDIKDIVEPALLALSKFGNRELSKALSQISQLEGAVKHAGDIRKQEADEAVKGHVRILSRTESSFVADLQSRSDAILKEISDLKLKSDGGDDDNDVDDEVPENSQNRKATLLVVSAIQAYALAVVRGRKLSSKSYNARIIDWLGDDRLPDERTLKKIGEQLEQRRYLRPLYRCAEKYVQFPRRVYNKYRSARLASEMWYNSAPEKTLLVHSSEVDLILLAMFRSTSSIVSVLPKNVAVDVKNAGLIGTLRSLYKAQIFIDEATDFSAVQLGIMYELSDPALHSIFLSGDFNQRLTKVGVKSEEELKWAIPGIVQHPIAIAYRQTKRLKELSQSIVHLDGGEIAKLDSPDGFQDADIKPALGENLQTPELLSQWLADRIFEIDKIRGDEVRPTIAVLVNDDDEARVIAKQLSEKLADINIDAVACVDGASIGDDNDVRIYDKRYIKGLEFEAVFFVGIDELEKQSEDLFLKYLYVGSSRAATFFAMTAKNEIPNILNSLKDQFSENWKII